MPVAVYNGIFSQMLTPISAYWFGFIVADGTIGHYGKCSRFGFVLKSEDAYAVRQLAYDLGYDKCKVKVHETDDSARFQASCKQLVADLECLGLMQRKSRKLDGTIIPSEYTSHFIRGLFDGDGSIGLYNVPSRTMPKRVFAIYGNKPLLEGVKSNIMHLGHFSMWTRPSTGVTQLATGSYSTIKGLYDYLYSDADRYLIRKRRSFDSVVSHRCYDSDKPKSEDGRNIIMITCIHCGTQKWRREDHAIRSKNHFCSRRCSRLFTIERSLVTCQ